MTEYIKKSFKRYTGLILAVLVIIILYRFITDTDFTAAINWTAALIKPFIFGFIIAYILNPVSGFFERGLYSRLKPLKNRKKAVKRLSMLTSYLLVAALVMFIVISIIPDIISSIQGLASYLFTYLPKAEKAVTAAIEGMETDVNGMNQFLREFNNSVNSIFDTVINNIGNVTSIMTNVLEGTFTAASWVLNLVIGIIISIYMLLDKEALTARCKRILFAFLPESWYMFVRDFVKDANATFATFIVSKAVDSIIIAVIFFLGCCFISPDYAMLFACVIGITNMIPYFGPFIGGIPVVLLCLLQNPYSAIWMLIFIFVLQQFDGYILGPRVMGDSIGVKPMGIIFAILVGGGLFGVLGMFFGVPVFAVIARIFDRFVERRAQAKEKKLNLEEAADGNT